MELLKFYLPKLFFRCYFKRILMITDYVFLDAGTHDFSQCFLGCVVKTTTSTSTLALAKAIDNFPAGKPAKAVKTKRKTLKTPNILSKRKLRAEGRK